MIQNTQTWAKHPLPLLVLIGLLLSACATTAPIPGETESAVIGKLGKPAGRYQVNQEQWLEYPTGPAGQYTYFAYMDAEGKLRSYEQVLNTAKFGGIEVDKATKDDVLRTIGHPGDTSSLRNPYYEIWSYHYKENGVWNSVMHVHFDANGVVRKMLNAPDREREHEPHEGFR